MSSSPPAARTRRGLRLVLLVACLGVGLVVGLVIEAAVLHPEPPAEAAPKRETPATPPPHTPDPTQTDLRAIDDLIRADCYDDALCRCQLARKTGAVAAEGELIYREAICLEGRGRWKEAGKAHRRAEELGANADAWAWSALGQARCALGEGDAKAARELLDRVVLRSERGDYQSRRLLEECLYLRAQVALLGLGPQRHPDPFEPETLAWPLLRANPADCLDRVPNGRHPEPRHGDKVELTAAVVGVPFASFEAVTVTWVSERERVLAERVQPSVSERGLHAAGALRRAVAVAPEHTAARAARVCLANLDFQAGRWREAAKEYRRLLDGDVNASVNLQAAYNLGLIEFRHGKGEAARKRFLEVGDRAPKSQWADLGYWWIGRSYLDIGDTANARRAFQTALSGNTRDVSAAAALGVCVCNLLDGDDEAVGQLLRDQRVGSSETHAALTTLFESVVRYRTRPSESRRATLLDALRACGEGRQLGLAGVLLVGDVYRELELDDRMLTLYESVLESAQGPLAIRMTYRVAERYDQIGHRQLARQRYLVVAALDTGALGAQAELRVAELATREGRGEECVRRCRGLIGRAGVERAEVLAVLGRGYELTGNFRQAAECFAGKLPTE